VKGREGRGRGMNGREGRKGIEGKRKGGKENEV
jgi:hypothetical protein